jgi:hypothetical protein
MGKRFPGQCYLRSKGGACACHQGVFDKFSSFNAGHERRFMNAIYENFYFVRTS